MDMESKDVIEHINREVDRRWEQERRLRDADRRHRWTVALAGGVVGFLSAATSVILVAGLFMSHIKASAVSSVDDHVRYITSDYDDIKKASIDLIKGVSVEAAGVREELGRAQQVLDDARDDLVELTDSLDNETRAELASLTNNLGVLRDELSRSERLIDDLFASLGTTRDDQDVERLRELLGRLKEDPRLSRILALDTEVNGHAAALLDLQESVEASEELLAAHASMLSGDARIPKLKIGRLTAFDGLGNERAALRFDDDSVHWWITMGNGHTLQQRVAVNKAGERIGEVVWRESTDHAYKPVR